LRVLDALNLPNKFDDVVCALLGELLLFFLDGQFFEFCVSFHAAQ
jgi:hypothetical protein